MMDTPPIQFYKYIFEIKRSLNRNCAFLIRQGARFETEDRSQMLLNENLNIQKNCLYQGCRAMCLFLFQ